MHKSQVERFVDRCFVRSTSHISFKKTVDNENYEQIGVICHSDSNCSWEIELNQSSLGISSCFFSGQVSYDSINNCEAVRL